MNMITTKFGQPSYTINTDLVSANISVQGGHLTAAFQCGPEWIDPFYYAPWWQEARIADMPEMINVLRGDFFCLPFGGNEEEYHGTRYLPHGKTSNADWDLAGLREHEGGKELSLTLDLDDEAGNVIKTIGLRHQEPVIYSTHRIEGFAGKTPVGHHALLKLPEEEGRGIVDMSASLTGFTPPAPIENPADGGYCRLRPNYEITDRSAVACMDGQSVDLRRFPLSRGFDDLALFISDPAREFAFTTLTLPEEGYLYFQLKHPAVLAATLFWMENGGRHYAPWNGRITSLIGLEEITAFFHYGIKPSVEANFLQGQGYPTFLNMDGNTPVDVNVILGLIPIEKSFTGVADIVKRDAETISILGKNQEKIDVPCHVDFLQ